MTLILNKKIDLYCKNYSILALLFQDKLTVPKLESFSDVEEICFLFRIKQLIHTIIKKEKQKIIKVI
jgi:hypothetical protein